MSVAPISAEELNDIAVESSQAERRAADAERELMEWKKMRFMADKIGDDFKAIILSVTKYGFFVELDELFIEGLVPIASLAGDYYSFRDTDRTICGARTGHCFRVGERVEVILDRVDRQQMRLQFALLPGTEPTGASGSRKTSHTEQRPKAKSKKGRRR
jgi:ribonuclease R